MKALGFSEHGSVFEWYHKKQAIEAAGMKYIHAVEAYLTETLEEKVRDNYHCVLIAKNHEGFRELNSLVSRSFCRSDNHFYYVPRISFDELFNTSENIIITSACVGGVFGKAGEETQKRFLDYITANRDRCFLEIGHHPDAKQVSYNDKIIRLSVETGLRLIAGTDTHVLNELHEKGRAVLQKSKDIIFPEEDGWDLRFHSYPELLAAYEKQGSVAEEIYLQAIENTNVLADMVEEFEIDKSAKYPHIYSDSEKVFRKKIDEAKEKHPYVNKRYSREKLNSVIESEFEVYKKTGSIDFMLLQTYLREWEKQNGIQCGYGRGSVSGSMIAYILGITQMDSIKFDLNFFRFQNPSRVSLCDVDTDYSEKDRAKVKEFLLRDKLGLKQIKTSEIITFNTIAMKGAVRDVVRALYKDNSKNMQNQRGDMSKNMQVSDYMRVSNYICSELEDNEEKVRKEYPQVFEYADIVNGTIVSVGTHPSGVLIADIDLETEVGLCSTAGSEYPVSMLNMKELDELMYVKLDILGLDNIGIVNDACKAVGIERLTPDNVDLDDEKVWQSIREDTTCIFQWESNSAQSYLKKFMSDKTVQVAKSVNPNFSYIKWLSFGNGLIRPGCASFRDDVAAGKVTTTGFKALDDFLSVTLGRITMQEDIMKFLKLFCGYSDAESDTVRRGIAKKKGTAGFIKEIHERFLDYSNKTYGEPVENLEKIFPPIERGILDASDYAFSWNHSDAYSVTGYICGYLRYYYPGEFITAALNIFKDKPDKTTEITKYAKRIGIQITTPKFGLAKTDYFYTPDKKIISKGLSSVKYIGDTAAEELYKISVNHRYEFFADLLKKLETETSINSRQIDTLIKIDFFSAFGNQRELFKIYDMYNFFKGGESKQIKREIIEGTPFRSAVEHYSTWLTKDGGEAKSYTLTDTMAAIRECEQIIRDFKLDDLSDIVKVKNFADIMGYAGYVSGKETDRRKLFVKEITTLKRKSDGKQFGYALITQSIGSGVESRFTVFNKVYNSDPIKKDDIILCRDFLRDGKYFTLTSYSHIYA